MHGESVRIRHHRRLAHSLAGFAHEASRAPRRHQLRRRKTPPARVRPETAIVVLGREAGCSFTPLHKMIPPAPAITSPVTSWLLEYDDVSVCPTGAVTVVVSPAF